MGKRHNSEGSVRQRKDGRWEARITVGINPDGTARRRSIYAATKDEARDKMHAALVAHREGTLAEPSRYTVAGWLDEWLRGKTHITESTRATYRHVFRYINEVIGNRRLQKLRPADVRELYTKLADTVVFADRGKPNPRKLSHRSQRYAAMALKAALREAVQLEIIVRNPAEAIKVGSPRVREKAQAWDINEVQQFLSAARGELRLRPTGGRRAKGRTPELEKVPPDKAEPDPLYPAFYIMLTLGLRRGEALGLHWSDIDLDQGKVRIRRSLTVSGSKCVVKEVKTPRSRRTLHLSHDAQQVLREHRKRQGEVRAFMGKAWQEQGFVFTTCYGTPVGPRNLSRTFHRLIKLAGVRPIRIHDLRHTSATLDLRRQTPVEVVSERLGHSSVGFTLDTYRHLSEAERREAALSLTDLLSEAGTRPVN